VGKPTGTDFRIDTGSQQKKSTMIGNPSPFDRPVRGISFTPIAGPEVNPASLDLLSDEIDAAAIEASHRGLWSDILCYVVNYWCAKRKGRAMPSRKDIDPLELRRLLPNIYLIDVVKPSLYRYRLVGTTISNRLRGDATGRFADEKIFGEHAHLIIEMYDHVVESRAPIINRARSFWTEVDWLNYTSVLLPLSPDGDNVTMMLGVMDFWLTPRQLRAPQIAKRLIDWEPLAIPAP
jgi:hypothetical protein